MGDRLVYHVDDSLTASKMIGEVLKSVLPGTELRQHRSGPSLIEALTRETTPPYLIFSDYNMPGMNGLEVLSWVKRNPKIHFVPFVMLAAEMDPKQTSDALKGGVFAHLSKPLVRADLMSVIERVGAQHVEASDWLALDKTFADETLEMIEEMHRLAGSVNDTSLKELYRLFHTIKGNAFTYHFPELGDFVHHAEGFLNAIRAGNLFGLPKVRELLTNIFGFLESQIEQVKAGQVMNRVRRDLLESLTLIQANVEAGWILVPGTVPAGAIDDRQQAHQAPVQEQGVAAGIGVVSRTAHSVRITNDRLDGLQQRFKRVVQLRTRLSSFANQLRAEFTDESFPVDLVRMVEELNTVSADIMEFFIQLRVVPASRLRTNCATIVAQTCDRVGKMARLEFDCEPGLELDMTVMEILESALTHVLRNSVDHGIEPLDARQAAGKDPAGLISVDLHGRGKEQFVLTLEDDGAGIDAEALKSAMLRKNLLTQEALERLPAESVFDLIFVDGLSTKDQVSEVSGRGVGLSAVKASIERAGGNIHVESILGKGTKFIIKMPRFFRL